jgi:uncharacterized RDD family membrane protein YckC
VFSLIRLTIFLLLKPWGLVFAGALIMSAGGMLFALSQIWVPPERTALRQVAGLLDSAKKVASERTHSVSYDLQIKSVDGGMVKLTLQDDEISEDRVKSMLGRPVVALVVGTQTYTSVWELSSGGTTIFSYEQTRRQRVENYAAMGRFGAVVSSLGLLVSLTGVLWLRRRKRGRRQIGVSAGDRRFGQSNKARGSGSNSPLGPSRMGDARQTEETRTEYAGYWRRLGGFLIDLALLIAIYLGGCFGIGLMIAFALVLTGHGISERGTPPVGWGWLLLLLLFVIPIGYYSFFESGRTQATPGKRMLDIYVTDLNGGRITLARALGRYFGMYLSLMFGVGFVMCVWTDRSQCLHDKLANTLVMRGRV